MKRLQLSILIDAPREKVWQAVTDPYNYREWTQDFEPTSYFEGEWKTGEDMLFLMKDENGKESGMVTEIAEARYPEFISIKHIGTIDDCVVDTESDEVRTWAPTYENYTLVEVGDKTEFVFEQDIEDKYEEMFKRIWPQALKKLKEVSERLSGADK